MLFGTGVLFRISYFFTSFAPALFILSLNVPLKFHTKNISKTWIKIFVSTLNISLYPLIIVILALISVFYLRNYLYKRQKSEKFFVKNLALNFDIEKKKLKNGHVIQVQNGAKINSGFISFATSVVAPSLVLSLANNKDIFIPLLIIIMFFLLLMMSNDVFPNIILPIFGVQMMETKDGYNLFYFSHNNDILSGTKKIKSLGDAGSLSRTYIISDEEFTSEEVENINEN